MDSILDSVLYVSKNSEHVTINNNKIDDINKKKQSNIFELTSNIMDEFIDKILVIDKTKVKVIYK